MATLHDGAIYGLHQFTFKGTVWGYISDDSIEWGGDNISTEDIWAAQKRRAPFKRLVSSPGSDVLSGDLIQLIPKIFRPHLAERSTKQRTNGRHPRKRSSKRVRWRSRLRMAW